MISSFYTKINFRSIFRENFALFIKLVASTDTNKYIIFVCKQQFIKLFFHIFILLNFILILKSVMKTLSMLKYCNNYYYKIINITCK